MTTETSAIVYQGLLFCSLALRLAAYRIFDVLFSLQRDNPEQQEYLFEPFF
jgi:hypothetical protein